MNEHTKQDISVSLKINGYKQTDKNINLIYEEALKNKIASFWLIILENEERLEKLNPLSD